MIILFLLFFTSSTSGITLSPHQKHVMEFSYHYGEKYGLGTTLAAIAWQESSFGLKLWQPRDPSAGIYHVLLSNAQKRYRSDSKTLKVLLIANPQLCAQLAVEELQYWLHYWHGNKFLALASYNGGFRPNYSYAYSILRKEAIIQQMMRSKSTKLKTSVSWSIYFSPLYFVDKTYIDFEVQA
jgi:hypothetical protein